jgi:hypothetical protein
MLNMQKMPSAVQLSLKNSFKLASKHNHDKQLTNSFAISMGAKSQYILLEALTATNHLEFSLPSTLGV